MFKEAIVLLAASAVFVTSFPQFPSPPQMPPNMPMPPGIPGMLQSDAEEMTRMKRHSPSPDHDQKPPARIARQAPNPDDDPKPPARFARHANFIESLEAPKKITQESYFSTITTFNREKRGVSKEHSTGKGQGKNNGR